MTTLGTPGIENPMRCRSPDSSATSYQMLGLRTGRCGSPASSGLPEAVREPARAQQFEPRPCPAPPSTFASAAGPSPASPGDSCGATSAHARPAEAPALDDAS